MRVFFFISVFLMLLSCNEKANDSAKLTDPAVNMAVEKTEPQQIEKKIEIDTETPDISEELKKLRKIPGENNDDNGSGGCTGYLDGDGDGYGTQERTVNFNCSGSSPTGFAKKSGDCNDRNRYINPGVKETCNGIDDNCDGITDPENAEGCNRYYKDEDEDGYGTGDFKCLCISEKGYSTLETGDCDDNKNKIHPNAKEICNEMDDNCNGEIDEGENNQNCRPFYVDNDGDGYGVDNGSKCLCKAVGIFRADMQGDCNDNNPAIYPGAHEYFDKMDNNCNGIIDENSGGFPSKHRKHNNKDRKD